MTLAEAPPTARSTRMAPVAPIAVIGMSCRLPGGIDTPERLWDALLAGADFVTEIPHDRWDPEEFYDPEPGVPGRSVSKWGAFLDDVAGFDLEFFGINEREAAASDPQHRLLLETSWEAMEHAGLPQQAIADTSTGVFVGLTHADYQLLAADAHAIEGPYGFSGSNFSMASGRIAYALGVHGPALTVDTACSSGLSAVHLACRSLHEGESDLAFAGGAALALDPRKWSAGSAQGMLSATGRCHTFDVEADGFVPGEGCVVVLLKRLTDAQRDGDRILAVVRGTATNQDGRTVNIATPSRTAQVAAYREALAAAGVDPATVGMVETHGTGTPTGDPIEYSSLAEVYGRQGPCALTSAKTNFGHTQSAAGVLGLMKAVLALQHGIIPQNLHFHQLPETMARIETNLFVPQSNAAWTINGDAPRRAAVSSYGVSGTNVHAVVEQAPTATESTPRTTAASPSLLFPISASSPDALRHTATQLADWLSTHDGIELPDLAYTLARRRTHRPVRTSVLARTREQLTEALRAAADTETPYEAAVGYGDRNSVWVFSGQGSQWASMGAELLTNEPVFAKTVAEIEPLIARESGFSVAKAISAPQVVSGQGQIQPALFTMQIALAAAMRSHGVHPGAVIGHSLGEAAAAVVAEALSLEDGVRLVCRRSGLMSRIAGKGATATVELPAKEVLSELTGKGIDDVVVAVVAAPHSSVIAGSSEAVRQLVSDWEQRGIPARVIPVDVAFHSPQVEPIVDDLAAVLADLKPLTPQVPFYSATLFDPREEPVCDANYWVTNMRRMVRFATAVNAALEDGHRVFAELAPHPLLTYALKQNAQSRDIPMAALAPMRRDQPLRHGLRRFVADLHCAGAPVDFSVSHPNGLLVDAPLPTWTHRQLWLSRERQESPIHGGCTVAVHPLLGSHVRLQEEPERHVWENDLGTSGQPWLADHQIRDVAVLPGAGYCEMALAAAEVALGGTTEIRDVRFERALLLDEHTTVSSSAVVITPGALSYSVHTNQDGESIRHATALLTVGTDERPPAHDIPALHVAHPFLEEGTQVRARMDRRGMHYGSAFTGLSAVHTGDEHTGTVLAEVALPRSIRSQQDAYHMHPALLDACFQAVEAHPAVQTGAGNALGLPLGIRKLRIFDSTRNARYCLAHITNVDTTGVDANIEVLAEDGAVLLALQGLRIGVGSEEARRDRLLSERLLTIEWHQRALPESDYTDTGAWLLINADADSAAAALADSLKSRGATCSILRWSVDADHDHNADQLRSRLRGGGITGVVILAGMKNGHADDQAPELGREHVRHLVRITRELPDMQGEPPRLYVVTRNAESVVAGDQINLEQAELRGLIRVIGTEHPHLRATQIDIDAATDADLLARQLLSESEEDETAWRNGRWYTARLSSAPLRPEERRTTIADPARHRMRLQIRTPGDLESLELVFSEHVPPGPGQIEVAVSASSVNFADVLVAFGRYPAFDGRLPQLGIDFAGVVTAVGPEVVDHKVGDRVAGLSAEGTWGTFLTCDAGLAVTIPEGLTDAQAAALTIATATAHYGLNDMARIAAGEKVLIHSATGGVGQAAIGIARAAGAEIFATAGSEQRRQLLHDMGIQHIYDSRSLDFVELIRADTDGYGLDIVLNSVTGAAQRAGLELLTFGGRFVEIGKRDIYSDTRLGLFPFRRNLSFYAVDLALMSVSHPERLRKLLSTVYRLAATGGLPMPEITAVPLADAASAIRMMGGAQHTGKLVLEIPQIGASRLVVPPAEVPVFRRDGAYIITGGLGGLGFFLAEKMVTAGCGRIVLSSRSRPAPATQEKLDHLRAAGADIVAECGDIADPDTAQRVVVAATATGLPLRGVLHAAGVIEDAALTNITDDLIHRDWTPKVHGAWNLHEATVDQPLDWFCSFSSAAALVGSPGQGAYAAANSWLDAFAWWRRAQGLPATTIAWGAWGEIGRGAALAERTGAAIAPEEGAYAFEVLLRHDRTYSGYAPIADAPWLTEFAERSTFAEAFRSNGQQSAGTSKLRSELDALPPEEWPARIHHLIADQVGLILRRSVDPDRPLSEYGIDSLSALELRTRIEAETGVRLSATGLTTIHDLTDQLCEKLVPAGTG